VDLAKIRCNEHASEDWVKGSEAVTQLLSELRGGKREAADRLFGAIYQELRALARGQVLRRPGAGMQPTEVVHEAYMRMLGQRNGDWQDRVHFLAVSAGMMRRVLADEARKQFAGKRGGEWSRVTLSDVRETGEQQVEDTLLVEELLERLEKLDARQAKVVELRFFAGMNMEEIAGALDLSKRTVEAEWTMARAWMQKELKAAAGDS
jgi:RNA polymerase sigma-70 factor, ECF subfamily